MAKSFGEIRTFILIVLFLIMEIFTPLLFDCFKSIFYVTKQSNQTLQLKFKVAIKVGNFINFKKILKKQLKLAIL